jgi:hypothetical protein
MLYDQPRNDWLKIDSPGGGPITAQDIAAQ